MNIKDYFRFVKWYFNHIGNTMFDNVRRWRVTRRRERLPEVIMAYIMMILSLIFIFTSPFKKAISYGHLLMITSIMFLYDSKFSFINYFIAYIKYKNKDKSINDSVIFQYGVLDGGESELFSMISKHFTPYVKIASPFSVKITLLAKGRTLRKKTSHIKKVLKITPNKVYFNRKIIFHKKLLDLADLEKFLIEEANNWN